MLAENNPELSPKLVCKEFITIPDINFIGSYARLTFYPIDSDNFVIWNVIIPSYIKLGNNKEVSTDTFNIYMRGEYPKYTYTNYYADFFGGDYALATYIFNNDSNRNLLLIGSSYVNSLEPLIASHYNHTYSIDLRYFKDFSFSKFINEHSIQDVLFFGDINTYGELHWQINL
jgi:hypothetical protein